MTIEETVNELDELTMYVEHAFTEEHKCKSFEALKMAIKSLEKQIPIKPIHETIPYECTRCECGWKVTKDDEYNYCPNCGQAIKWE